MDHTALAYAAWAGHCMARGRTDEAEQYRQWAEQAAGRIITGHIGGGDGLYVVSESGEPCAEDVDYLIDVLKIIRSACKSRAEKKAAENAKATASAAAEGKRPEAQEGARASAAQEKLA